MRNDFPCAAPECSYSGQGLGEYLIILFAVAVIVLATVRVFGKSVRCQFRQGSASIDASAEIPDECLADEEDDEGQGGSGAEDAEDEAEDESTNTPSTTVSTSAPTTIPPTTVTTTLPTTTTVTTTTSTRTTSTTTSTRTTTSTTRTATTTTRATTTTENPNCLRNGQLCRAGVPSDRPIPWQTVCPQCCGGKPGWCSARLPNPWNCYCPLR